MKKITNSFGDYSRQVVVEVNGERIQCDWELATEIAYLNLIGVKTVASCSGHGRLEPNIVVYEEFEDDMERLGYESSINEHGVKLYKAKTDWSLVEVKEISEKLTLADLMSNPEIARQRPDEAMTVICEFAGTLRPYIESLVYSMGKFLSAMEEVEE